ncbi:hypothetical protein PRUB_b1240 [Pseudoalteromonas rubra]|uniref:Uncharacterized protein n=1 Tax=Pseudoalteromonas rubra TaxID=43658 RepID=A0A8T0C1J4_9GAMM|nr:hypothetical protein PRUB_b1240 [Pseudoalteromonas rubra]
MKNTTVHILNISTKKRAGVRNNDILVNIFHAEMYLKKHQERLFFVPQTKSY